MQLVSRVPYTIFSDSHPFFRNYDKDFYEQSDYMKWTETRFFSYDQLQDSFISEYPNTFWMLSDYDRIIMKKELNHAFDPKMDNFDFKFGIHYKFTR